MEVENDNGMNPIRYEELAVGVCDQLTDEEVANGWYFDNDADGVLMNKNWK